MQVWFMQYYISKVRKKGCYLCVFQGRTYSFGSDASFARQDALGRSVPKRITRSDKFSRLMMESLRFDWPGEEPNSGNTLTKARHDKDVRGWGPEDPGQ